MKLCDLFEGMYDLESGYHLLMASLRDSVARYDRASGDVEEANDPRYDRLIKFHNEAKAGAEEVYRALTLAAEDEGFQVDRRNGDRVSVVVDHSDRKVEVSWGSAQDFSWVGIRQLK